MTNQMKIAIVDYKMCNLFSVEHACRNVGMEPVITSDPCALLQADGVILPGVGAFGDAMENLRRMGLVAPLRRLAEEDKPLMCICLGLQLLFSESEEFGINQGLGIVPGSVRKFPTELDGVKLLVPFIGWNNISIAKSDPCLEGIEDASYMYFVHSFYADPADMSLTLTNTSYSSFKYCSSIAKGNILGFQFHPEKSGDKGIRIYRNWKSKIENRRARNGKD